MKIDTFVPTARLGTGPLTWRFFAHVNVTTGVWPFRKTTIREVARNYAAHWRFVDTGKLTPANTVENLEDAYCMQRRIAGLEEATI